FSPPTPPSERHPLSLHDALPISDDTLGDEGGSTTDVEPGGTADDDSGSEGSESGSTGEPAPEWPPECLEATPTEEATCMVAWPRDRKSTRLNSSHVKISYAVFCL